MSEQNDYQLRQLLDPKLRMHHELKAEFDVFGLRFLLRAWVNSQPDPLAAARRLIAEWREETIATRKEAADILADPLLLALSGGALDEKIFLEALDRSCAALEVWLTKTSATPTGSESDS